MRPPARARTTQTHRALTTPTPTTPTPTPTPKTPLRPSTMPMTSSVPRHRRSRGAPRPSCACRPAPTPPTTKKHTKTRTRACRRRSRAPSRRRASMNASNRWPARGHPTRGPDAECPNVINGQRLSITPRDSPEHVLRTHLTPCAVRRKSSSREGGRWPSRALCPSLTDARIDCQRTFIMVRHARETRE